VYEITLTKLGVRFLELNVSTPTEKRTNRDSRRWHKIAEKLLDAIRAWDDQVQALVDEAADAELRLDLSYDERNDENRRIAAAIRTLERGPGQEKVVVRLEDSELKYLRTEWFALKLPDDRKTRAIKEEISEALDKPTRLKLVGDRLVPDDTAANPSDDTA
jgi:hypothetical protein